MHIGSFLCDNQYWNIIDICILAQKDVRQVTLHKPVDMIAVWGDHSLLVRLCPTDRASLPVLLVLKVYPNYRIYRYKSGFGITKSWCITNSQSNCIMLAFGLTQCNVYIVKPEWKFSALSDKWDDSGGCCLGSSFSNIEWLQHSMRGSQLCSYYATGGLPSMLSDEWAHKI